MKIVVLDGFTLNPGDLDWGPLRSLGECTVFDRTSAEEVVARSAGAEILLTNKVPLPGDFLRQLPAVQYIGVMATGYNVVDISAARARGIVVTNVPDYSRRSVAQLTIALLLELTHRVGQHSEEARQGRWSRNRDFTYWNQPLRELDGLTFGIVGFGRIGAAVAEVATALGLRILAHTRRPPRATSVPVTFVGLDDVFRGSDVVSLHCPLTPQTLRLVNADRLSQMKPSAYLLNTSRGALVDEAALALALNQHRLAGAGLDVLSSEPPPPDHPLLSARNCVLTPHFGWATTRARERLLLEVADNLRAFLHGGPRNVVAELTATPTTPISG